MRLDTIDGQDRYELAGLIAEICYMGFHTLSAHSAACYACRTSFRDITEDWVGIQEGRIPGVSFRDWRARRYLERKEKEELRVELKGK